MQGQKDRGYSLKIDKEIEIGGVKKAIECTDRNVKLQLDSGALTLSGQNLDVRKLDMETGVAILTGDVYSVSFGALRAKGLLSGLFK